MDKNIDQQATTNEKPNSNVLQENLDAFAPFNNILIIFGICFVCVTFVFNIILKPLKITGPSMQPTINASYSYSNLKYDSVYYVESNDYKSDDIVIINNNGETIIKRIVATAGETVTITRVPGTEVYSNTSPSYLQKVEIIISITDVNGNSRISDNYMEEATEFLMITDDNRDILGKYEAYKKIDTALKSGNAYSFLVPENQLFCLGDNRNNSTDSRHYGCFNVEQIKGELALHIPYGKSLLYAIWHAIFG